MRRLLWLVCLAFAGCQSFGDVASLQPLTPLGQILPKPLRLTPLAEDPLLPLASQALERGDQAAACDLLREYVARHPESKQTRVYFAEVLAKLGKNVEATIEFEKAVASLQDDKTLDLAMIVHCHGRVIDLADADGDQYHVRLHRGLGLYWLAQQRRFAGSRSEAEDDKVPTEAILCKAAMELIVAHSLLPDEARSSWYLYLTWRQLGQSAPAQRWLREAQANGVDSYLTPREQHEMHLVGR